MFQWQQPEFSTAPELSEQLSRMVDLWPAITAGGLTATHVRHPTNVIMIYAFSSHVVELAKGVLALYGAGLAYCARPLIRASMESAVTAAWLSVSPEQTRGFLEPKMRERLATLGDVTATGRLDLREALVEAETVLKDLEGSQTNAGLRFRDRFEELEGGADLHISYRILTQLTHPTPLLADQWLWSTPKTTRNPVGLAIRSRPNIDEGGATAHLGVQLCMVILAEIAMDTVMPERRAQTVLSDMARKLGIRDAIRRADGTSRAR